MVARLATALGLPHAILTWEGAAQGAGSASASAGGALRSDGCLLPRPRHSGAGHRSHSRRSGRDLPDAAQARQRPRWPRCDPRDGRLGRGRSCSGRCSTCRRRGSSPRSMPRGIGFVSDPSNSDPRFERARVRGSCERARGAWPHARGAGAVGAASQARARGARSRGSRLPRRQQRDERGGLRTCRPGGVRRGAAGDRAARALAPDRRGGRWRGGVTACQARSVACRLQANPGKTQTLGRCRIEPLRRPARHLPRDEGARSPCDRASPGQRALWDNRFRIELGAGAPKPGHGAGARRIGACSPCATRSAFASLAASLRGADVACLLQGRALAGSRIFGAQLRPIRTSIAAHDSSAPVGRRAVERPAA